MVMASFTSELRAFKDRHAIHGLAICLAASVAVLAKIWFRSPRKWFILIVNKYISKIKVSQKMLKVFLKKTSLLAAGLFFRSITLCRTHPFISSRVISTLLSFFHCLLGDESNVADVKAGSSWGFFITFFSGTRYLMNVLSALKFSWLPGSASVFRIKQNMYWILYCRKIFST